MMPEELNPEDLLRLSVLLTQDIKAIRIDESAPALHALTDKGEASMPLCPTCRPDRYFRLLREHLSGHALGSPGGYPVYLSRWTRHGQMESGSLAQLLLIGEPEAVVAVVHSPALTDELAAYAWWAMPSIEHARLMLAREAVAKGRMGRILADFLVEHLPFLQEDNLAIMDTVAVLLASGILSESQRVSVWKRGKRQNSYYVAFLEMCPGDLPLPLSAHPGHKALAKLVGAEVAIPARIRLLTQALSGQGQAFAEACLDILERPETQEVVNRTLNAIGRHFSLPNMLPLDPALAWLRSHAPALEPELSAVTKLAGVGEALVGPIFARSSAIGSLMRRKLEPITAPIRDQLRTLRSAS